MTGPFELLSTLTVLVKLSAGMGNGGAALQTSTLPSATHPTKLENNDLPLGCFLMAEEIPSFVQLLVPMFDFNLGQRQRSDSWFVLFGTVRAARTTRRITTQQLHCSANQHQNAGSNDEKNNGGLPVHGFLGLRSNEYN